MSRRPFANQSHFTLARFEQCLDEDEDEEAGTNYNLLVYLELMRAVNQSLSRKQPLWVVK